MIATRPPEARAPAVRRSPGELVALLTPVALAAAILAGADGTVRTPLAVLFSFWVPGTAVVAWLPWLTPAERRGIAVTLSLAASTVVPTVALWLHWWHPGGLLALTGAASVLSLLVAPRRRPAATQAAAPLPRQLVGALGVAAGAGAVALLQLRVEDHVVGDWGLLPQLPLAWFLAVAALVVAGGLAIRTARRGPLAAVALLLVALLHGTTAVAYAVPRFPWTFKHVGVTEFILDHGRLSSGIDIYHNWPGFFSMVAQLFELGGVDDPGTLLRWWPALIGVASVAVLRFLFGAFTDDPRVQWGAVTLFVAANWFGQDYFAPQSVAFLMAFGTFGLLFRTSASAERLAYAVGRSERAVLASAAIVTFAAVTVTHQLTPYLVLPGIVVAALIGGVKPRWIAVACALIAIAYLVPRFEWVQSHGGIGSSSVRDNVRSPAAELAGAAWSITVGNWASRIVTVGLAVLSIPHLLRFRGDRWWLVFLLSNLIGPACVLLVQAYGNEGVLRTALFVTPWTAFATAWWMVDRRPRARRWSAALGCTIALCVLATWAIDTRYRIGPEEVRIVRTFEQSAPPGALIAHLGPSHLPVRATSRYPMVEYTVMTPFSGEDPPSPSEVVRRLEAASESVARRRAVYVASTASADRFARLFGYGDPARHAQLRELLLRSPRWEAVLVEDGAVLLRYSG